MAITNPDGSEYTAIFHPNPLLALAIVKAWEETRFRNRLLADESEVPLTPATAQQSYRDTSRALSRIGLEIDKPVVMTLTQYNAHYQRAWDEAVFVLPNELAPGAPALPAAQIAMAITPCGM